MSESSKKKLNKEESKILEKSEARDNVAEGLSSSQVQNQESKVLNSSSNSLKKSFKANNLEKKEKEKEKEEESDIEYDDVYVVEERTIPTAEIDNQDDEDLNEELSLSLSSEDDNFEIINSDYDKIKLASEKSKKKIERKKDMERLDKILEEKVDFTPKTIKRDEVVEDFIRNFFTQMKLNKTLDEFNQEYAELSKKGRFNDNYLGPITDIYIKNAKLEEKLERMQKELDKANKNAEEVKSNWENLRKERDFHKENYIKTVQEKTNIANDIKTLQNLHNDFTSKIADLNLKYEHLCKNKSLMIKIIIYVHSIIFIGRYIIWIKTIKFILGFIYFINFIFIIIFFLLFFFSFILPNIIIHIIKINITINLINIITTFIII